MSQTSLLRDSDAQTVSIISSAGTYCHYIKVWARERVAVCTSPECKATPAHPCHAVRTALALIPADFVKTPPVAPVTTLSRVLTPLEIPTPLIEQRRAEIRTLRDAAAHFAQFGFLDDAAWANSAAAALEAKSPDAGEIEANEAIEPYANDSSEMRMSSCRECRQSWFDDEEGCGCAQMAAMNEDCEAEVEETPLISYCACGRRFVGCDGGHVCPSCRVTLRAAWAAKGAVVAVPEMGAAAIRPESFYRDYFQGVWT